VFNLLGSDIDSSNMLIRVHGGKGGKDRFTILGRENLLMLRRFFLLETAVLVFLVLMLMVILAVASWMFRIIPAETGIVLSVREVSNLSGFRLKFLSFYLFLIFMWFLLCLTD